VDFQNRVVVTGMGVVAPNGIGLEPFWDSLIHCKSGIGPITLFDTTGFSVKFAGEVRDFNLHDYCGREFKPGRLARQTQLGLAACKMAVEHAGLNSAGLKKLEPLSLVMGICCSAIDITERAKELMMTHGVDRVRPYMVGASQPHAVSAALSSLLDVQLSISTISSACPSGLDAVAAAAGIIRKGSADLVIAGASDSPLNAASVASFIAAGIPPVSPDLPPEEVSRPFDAGSIGGPMAEGAGFVVLERMDSALARGAVPYMEILGGATLSDPPGTAALDGLFKTMSQALENTGIHPSRINYICANAISHLAMDLSETRQIKQLLGEQAYRIPVSSIKGVTGNPLAAAGVFQVIACALAMKNGVVPPTANLQNPAPGCDLDYVALHPRRYKINTAMANMHGMGGENSALIMRRIE